MHKIDLEELRSILDEDPTVPEPDVEHLALWAADELDDERLDELLYRCGQSDDGIAMWRAADAIKTGGRFLEGRQRRGIVAQVLKRHLPLAASFTAALISLGLWLNGTFELSRVQSTNAMLTDQLKDENAQQVADPVPVAPLTSQAESGSAPEVELLPAGTPVLELERQRGDEKLIPSVTVVGEAVLVPLVVTIPGARGSRKLELALFGSGDSPAWEEQIEVDSVGSAPLTILLRLPKSAMTEPLMHLVILRRQPAVELFQLDLRVSQ